MIDDELIRRQQVLARHLSDDLLAWLPSRFVDDRKLVGFSFRLYTDHITEPHDPLERADAHGWLIRFGQAIGKPVRNGHDAIVALEEALKIAGWLWDAKTEDWYLPTD